MQLYQIQEPGQNDDSLEYKTQESTEIAVGIDLGTTNSLISISNEGKQEIIKQVPSVVLYEKDQAIVGDEALGRFEKNNTVVSIKRLMGKGKEDIKNFLGLFPFKVDTSSEGLIRLSINDTPKTPIEISADIITVLKSSAEQKLDRKVSKAVITVPAHFDDAARQATKDAAKLAGLDVLRLVNEPTAAAVAYGLDKQAEGIFAVYDLGGGTFDISILKLHKGVFQVLSTGGDASLGGDDFDRAILEYLYDKYDHKELKTSSDLLKATYKAREIKEHLSTQDSCSGIFPFIDEQISFTSDEFNQAISPYIKKTMRVFNDCLEDAELEVEDIKEVLLVGGSTRIPAIKVALEKLTGKKPLDSINPDEIVAIGASVQGEALSTGSGNLLLDVTPLSLGIELMAGITEPIIPRNTPIPVMRKQKFTTQKDNQTGFKIHVIQGESEDASKCRSLAHFELKGIPALPAGEAKLEISFQVDADGLLTVTAEELSTGAKQEVEVKPSYGLTEGEIISILKQQIETNAK